MSRKNPDFRITGIKGVQDVLKQVSEKDAPKLNRNFTRGVAAEATKMSKQKVTQMGLIQSGDMKKAIKTKTSKTPRDEAFAYVGIQKEGYYWRAVNKGHEFAPPKPFIDDTKAHFEKNMDVIAEEAMKKVLIRKIKADLKKARNRKR